MRLFIFPDAATLRLTATRFLSAPIARPGDWTFDERVAEVFPDMIQRSRLCYPKYHLHDRHVKLNALCSRTRSLRIPLLAGRRDAVCSA